MQVSRRQLQTVAASGGYCELLTLLISTLVSVAVGQIPLLCKKVESHAPVGCDLSMYRGAHLPSRSIADLCYKKLENAATIAIRAARAKNFKNCLYN